MILADSQQRPTAPRAIWLLLHASAVFAFLYLPIAVLILYSFNGQGVGGFPPHHLTLDWYRILFADAAIWDAVLYSLKLALAAIVIALGFGIPAALALGRANTLPLEIWRRLRRGITPEINAVSTIIFLFSLLTIVFWYRLRSQSAPDVGMELLDPPHENVNLSTNPNPAD